MGRPMQFEAECRPSTGRWTCSGVRGTPERRRRSWPASWGSAKAASTTRLRASTRCSCVALGRYSERRLELPDRTCSRRLGRFRPRLKEALTVLAGVGEHRRGCVMVNAAAELGTADDEVNRIADRPLHANRSRVSESHRAGARSLANSAWIGLPRLPPVNCLPLRDRAERPRQGRRGTGEVPCGRRRHRGRAVTSSRDATAGVRQA
jgi:hypothetical protein